MRTPYRSHFETTILPNYLNQPSTTTNNPYFKIFKIFDYILTSANNHLIDSSLRKIQYFLPKIVIPNSPRVARFRLQVPYAYSFTLGLRASSTLATWLTWATLKIGLVEHSGRWRNKNHSAIPSILTSHPCNITRMQIIRFVIPLKFRDCQCLRTASQAVGRRNASASDEEETRTAERKEAGKRSCAEVACILFAGNLW